jgi:hypothetical protein
MPRVAPAIKPSFRKEEIDDQKFDRLLFSRWHYGSHSRIDRIWLALL